MTPCHGTTNTTIQAMRNLLQLGPIVVIIRLGITFGKICAKVINPNDLSNLRTYVPESLCHLEIWFPLAFFDLMIHLLTHLVDELEICGLVGARWCYPMERYLNVLKRYIRNGAWPKACMAFGYMYDEVLGFCMENFALYPHIQHQMWDPNEEEKDNSEVLEGWAQFKKLSILELQGIHEHVIINFVATEEGL
jgi:hypothetical protein